MAWVPMAYTSSGVGRKYGIPICTDPSIGVDKPEPEEEDGVIVTGERGGVFSIDGLRVRLLGEGTSGTTRLISRISRGLGRTDGSRCVMTIVSCSDQAHCFTSDGTRSLCI